MECDRRLMVNEDIYVRQYNCDNAQCSFRTFGTRHIIFGDEGRVFETCQIKEPKLLPMA